MFNFFKNIFNNYINKLLKSMKLNKIPDKWIFIFDIDDTLIFEKDEKLNKDVFKFYNYVKNKIKVYIITNRSDKSRDVTKQELFYNKIKDYIGLKLRKVNENPLISKIRMRNEVEKEGYCIVGCIGDQIVDFKKGMLGIYLNKNYLNNNDYPKIIF